MWNKDKCILIALIALFLSVGMGAQETIYESGVIRVKLAGESVRRLSARMRTGEAVQNPGQYIKSGIAPLDAALERSKVTRLKRMIPYDARYESRYEKTGLNLWYELETDLEDINEAIHTLGVQPEILVAEPVVHVESQASEGVTYTINDPDINRQWNYLNTGENPLIGSPAGVAGADINLFPAWEITAGTPDIVVAILDTGLELTHPDLMPNLWTNEGEKGKTAGVDDDGNGYVDDIHGYNFVTDSPDIIGETHGTHVAGLVSASRNNGIGIAGVAGGTGSGDGARLMACTIIQSKRTGNIPAAFVYAANNGANIAQCSWTHSAPNQKSQAVLDAIDYFVEYAGRQADGTPRLNTRMTGGLVVFAAGNYSTEQSYYPAYYERCFTVSSTDIDNLKAGTSNYGDWVDICAPGGWNRSSCGSFGQIWSTWIGSSCNYQYGTSMAAPQVSGVAALILSVYGNENYTPEMLKHRMSVSATPMSVYPGKMGAGRLNAFGALSATIPDVEANLYFGEFSLPKNNGGERPMWTLPLRILNSGDAEMTLDEISVSDNQHFSVNGFTQGMTVSPKEYIDLRIDFKPTTVRGYRETLTIRYGGAFAGAESITNLVANVLNPADNGKIIVFADDFDRGLYNWLRYDGDNDGRTWISDYNKTSVLSHSGRRFAFSESGTGTPLNPSNWLVSPEIDLSGYEAGADMELSYWVRTTRRENDGEKYRVLLSTEGGDRPSTASFTKKLIEEEVVTSDFNSGYNLRTISLSEYAGQKIRIAFVHETTVAKEGLVLDDVEVCYYPTEGYADVKLISLVNPLSYLIAGEPVHPTVKIVNLGTKAAKNVKIICTLVGHETEEIGEISSIAPGDTIEYRSDISMNINEYGVSYPLIIEVACNEDIFTLNNKLEADLWLNPYHSLLRWDFESGTIPDDVLSVGYDKVPTSAEIVYHWDYGKPAYDRFNLTETLSPTPPEWGKYCIASASMLTDPAIATDRWLMMSVPALDTQKLILRWSAYAASAGREERYEVLASSTGNTRENFTVLTSVFAHFNEAGNHLLDISQYAGKPFHLAFRHNTEQNGVGLLLDNICLLSPDAEPSGITDQESEKVSIYPNPVKGACTIECNDMIEYISVYDLTGRTVYTAAGNGSRRILLDTDSYPSGVYFLRIKAGNKIYTEKIYVL